MTLVVYSNLIVHSCEEYLLVPGTIDEAREELIKAIQWGIDCGLTYESYAATFEADELEINDFTFKSLTGAPAIQKVFKDFLGERFGAGVIPQIFETYRSREEL